MSICIVLYVCDIYVLNCVFFFFFSVFFLMTGKTFVMFGYANKEFEFESNITHVALARRKARWPDLP